MTSKRGSCVNAPDGFCYICGEYMKKEHRFNVREFTKKAYQAYFGIKLGDQNKRWAPHKVCKNCSETLRLWTQGKVKAMRFGVPMVWREPKNHHDDCFFCMVNMSRWNRHKKGSWYHPDIDSARRLVAHCEDVPIPVFCSLPQLDSSNELRAKAKQNSGDDSNFSDIMSDTNAKLQHKIKPFTQDQLNDLIRDLALSKKAAEVLASRLNEHGILDSETKITFYRHREEGLSDYFVKEDNFVICQNIRGPLTAMGIAQYKPDEWRLFIDSSKRSLKCVLLHNANIYASVPIGHSVALKESYSTVKMVLQKLCNEEHKWLICVDLKMVNFLLGQQGGYVKYLCFLCQWDSRADDQHWQRKDWPLRKELVVGANNVINEPLVDRDSILLPPLHIKLGLMKQFVKALDKNGDCFLNIRNKFPATSHEKVKGGIFDGPQM